MTPLEVDQWITDTILNLKTTHKGKVFERVFVLENKCNTKYYY